MHPAPHGLGTRYGVQTVKGAVLDVRVGATVTAVTVKGKIGADLDPWTGSFAHPDPVELFGAVLAGGLAARGVQLRGEVRRERGPPPGEELFVLRSSLADALVPVNTLSANAVADQVFLATGAAAVGDGTRAGGARATALALERLGVPPAGLVQVDGSGLSRDNRATPRQIAALVDGLLALDPATARAFRESLALAGRTGTLDDRMRGTAAEGRVRAKTGWIRGASALSGVTTTAGGRELVFSILVSYPRELGGLNTNCFKPMHDAIAVLLTELEP